MFYYNSIEHKIYNYPHKDAVQAMFTKKTMATIPKKEDVVNMVLVVITRSQILENVVFKEK
jgi:hypothetical protein